MQPNRTPPNMTQPNLTQPNLTQPQGCRTNSRAVTLRLLSQWKDVQDSLTLMDCIGLALRRQRNTAGTSQREHALQSGWSKSHQARLETDPGRLKLVDVLTALEGTGYRLELRDDSDGRLVEPFEWYPTELVARYRDGRRFPAAVNPVRWTPRTWFYTRHPFDRTSPDWTWFRRGRLPSSTSGMSGSSLGSEMAENRPPDPLEEPCERRTP